VIRSFSITHQARTNKPATTRARFNVVERASTYHAAISHALAQAQANQWAHKGFKNHECSDWIRRQEKSWGAVFTQQTKALHYARVHSNTGGIDIAKLL